jgi:hypothetical protein
MAAIDSDVLSAGDTVAPLQAAERSGLARLDSSVFGEEVAPALDAQQRAQADTLLQQPLPISASELEDWVAAAARKGVCGLVLAQEAQHVMVLGPGGSTVPTAQRFRDAAGAAANPSLCLLQLPATRVRVLTELVQTSFDDEVANLPEVRVAVIHRDRGIRALWQRHLALAGAEVLFDEVEDAALATLGESAPDLLVIHEDALCDLTRTGGWADVRLQFSSLLVVSAIYAREIHPADLVAEAADLLATQVNLRARIAEADVIVDRVESLGPARWLRELQGYDGLVELRMHAPQGTARVLMESGELHVASYWRDGEELQGAAALSALQDTRFGSLIVGPAQQVADADRNDRVHAVPSPVAPQSSTIARPSSSCSRAEPRASTSRPDTAHASALSNQLVGHGGATLRSRAIAVAALALLATVGAALRWTAPTSRERLAVAASGAAEHAARPASGAPGAEAVVIPPAADTPTGPGVTQATAEGALCVAPPAPEAAAPGATQAPPAQALSVVQPVAVLGVTGTADPGPDAAPPPIAAAPQPTPASTAPATSSANIGVGNEASTGAPALPARLRRWLKPTPVQQRVIDAFWARADKNFVRAERLLSEAHALDPKDAEVAYQLALTYARQGRLEQTLSWARQARELGPLDPAPVALEGDIHALRGQRLDAERVWKQCLQVRPGDPGCVRRLEQLKSRSGS